MPKTLSTSQFPKSRILENKIPESKCMKNFKGINLYCNILKKDEIDFLIPPGSL